MDFSKPETYLEGNVLFIDKPLNWTSFDVVNKIRWSLKTHLGIKKIKVGHAGTLDPLATGLVIVCTGRATKQIMQYQDLGKVYDAHIRLGASTPSFDLETAVDQTFPWEHITREMVEEALIKFTGEQLQMPPIYSAKSVDGKRAYDMARKGKEIVLKKQLINISKLELLSIDLPELTVHVECGKGTYIRSLAHDLGEELKSGAHLAGLRRTSIGPHNVSDAISPDKFIETLKLL